MLKTELSFSTNNRHKIINNLLQRKSVFIYNVTCYTPRRRRENMKKSKVSLCLASGFVVAMSLAACSSVSSKDNVVVTIKNYDGQQYDILTDAVYNKYKTETDGVSKFYNAILESLIRYEYQNPNSAVRQQAWSKAIKSNSEIKSEAENNVKNDKNTASENADTNGTSYETEWEAILSSHNCEDEDELLEYYIYQLEKDDITDKFFLYQKDSTLTQEWLGVKDDGSKASDSVKGVFPYHIRHVLTSISGGNTNFYDGTITSEEAKNLKSTIEALINHNKFTFADVAKQFSGDSGSGAKGGDVGIMATTTSFVNEFKLGIYAYDCLYTNNALGANTTIKEGVGINSNYNVLDLYRDDKSQPASRTVEDVWTNKFPTNLNLSDTKTTSHGIQEVPFDAFELIGQMAEVEKDGSGKQVNKGNSHYFPRNVLYNYYLNFHNPFVITNKVINDTTGFPEDYDGRYDTNEWFNGASFNGNGYLTDEDGNVIIGCRSEHGIHFMIMEKSIHEYQEGGNTKATTSLEDYYTTLTPSDADFPSYEGKQKDTYVSYIQTNENSTYTSRASEIKSAVKSFDSTYDYRLFEYIFSVEGENISIKDSTLKTSISEYISRTRETNKDSADKTLNEAWRTYTELVALQYENRTDDWKTTDETVTNRTTSGRSSTFRTIHPRCAVGFKNHSGDAWKEATGGICYYED